MLPPYPYFPFGEFTGPTELKVVSWTKRQSVLERTSVLDYMAILENRRTCGLKAAKESGYTPIRTNEFRKQNERLRKCVNATR